MENNLVNERHLEEHEDNVSNTLTYVTHEELAEMKNQINQSFEEIVEMLVGFQSEREAFLERVEKFNKRSSYKI